MSFLFKPKKTQNATELVKNTKEFILKLDSGERKKLNEEISKNLLGMKAILYGEGESEPSPDLIIQLSTELQTHDLLPLLIAHLSKLDFEARKDVAQIFNNLLRRQIGTRFPIAEYILNKKEVLESLVLAYENQEIALNAGMILRECIRHESLARTILTSPYMWNFFKYVQLSTFDVASDAFATFKDLLIKHDVVVVDVLEKEYDRFFGEYTTLLNSENYVTKRQSIKLLGELLLNRTNFSIMTRYITSPENLKLLMNLLRDKSRNIQFEAFHVFKVFVANPNKPKPILDILVKNKEKLVVFLQAFHNDRTDDEQFNEEKTFLIQQVQALE